MSAIRLGWVGVGAMGSPMCRNLLRANWALAVHDKRGGQVHALREAGAAVARSPGALAAESDVLFSTIYDDEALREIVLADDGIAAARRSGLIYVDMSTVSPAASAEVARALAQRGIRYLRAPVSGTVALAQSAQLSAFVSGEREAFEQIQPILACLTARQRYVGANEEARVVKLMINLMVFMSTAVIGEALSFGAHAGLDRHTMVDAINDSIVGSAHYSVKADKLKRRDYAPAGSLNLVAKDLDLALAVARQDALPMPLSSLVRQYLALLQGRGLGELDVAALADVLDLISGDIGDADLLTGAGAAG